MAETGIRYAADRARMGCGKQQRALTPVAAEDTLQ
jgi:hypothetical protein